MSWAQLDADQDTAGRYRTVVGNAELDLEFSEERAAERPIGLRGGRGGYAYSASHRRRRPTLDRWDAFKRALDQWLAGEAGRDKYGLGDRMSGRLILGRDGHRCRIEAMEQHTADDMLEHCRAMMTIMHGGGMESMTPPDGMMGGGMMSMSTGMLLFGLLGVALVVALGVTIVWFLLRRRTADGGEEARRTLDLRYARGEVDQDTYLRMRADLAEGTASAREGSAAPG